VLQGGTTETRFGVTLGAVLAPIACLLVAVLPLLAATHIWHVAHAPLYPVNPNGISSKRRLWSILYFGFFGLLPILVVASLWFDWFGLHLDRRSRMALFGFVGVAVGLMGLLLILYGGGVVYA
jgi:hypothetical protein